MRQGCAFAFFITYIVFICMHINTYIPCIAFSFARLHYRDCMCLVLIGYLWFVA